MCGIVGYAGARKAAPLLLRGLEKLEYRGYDSSGIAVINDGKIEVKKACGRLSRLIDLTDGGKNIAGRVGIGHTRWATHGKPCEKNCHPHLSNDGKFAVVHNGIVENYAELRKFLNDRGFVFRSDTDSETIAQLLEYFYDGDVLDAIRKTVNELRGSYALGILLSDTPDVLYAARKNSPLVVGIGNDENAIASDIPALLDFTRRFVTIEDDEIVRVFRNKTEFYDKNLNPVEKRPFIVDMNADVTNKGNFAHFMLKEIYEQPRALAAAIEPRIADNKIVFENFPFTDDDLACFSRIDLIGCGSAYNACVAAKYFIESVCRVRVNCDLASEYRYRDPVTGGDVLSVFVSQSGETADTLAALRLCRKKGSPSVAIVNAVGSSLSREADCVLYTNAGPEIAVATTKGYVTQVAVLYMLGLKFAEALNSDKTETAALINDLRSVPEKVKLALKDNDRIKQVASTLGAATNAFFIGRGRDYATATEAALKLKEISYIHAESYAAGELKHGTISLIEEGTPVFVIATDPRLSDKTLSNAEETASRGAKIISIVSADCTKFDKVSTAIFKLPDCNPKLSPLLDVIYFQLLAYHAAVERGCSVDKPRNLAKSVTVE